jgi:hypothetical protein
MVSNNSASGMHRVQIPGLHADHRWDDSAPLRAYLAVRILRDCFERLCSLEIVGQSVRRTAEDV